MLCQNDEFDELHYFKCKLHSAKCFYLSEKFEELKVKSNDGHPDRWIAILVSIWLQRKHLEKFQLVPWLLKGPFLRRP